MEHSSLAQPDSLQGDSSPETWPLLRTWYPRLAAATAFLIPLKLAGANVTGIPAILIWIFLWFRDRRSKDSFSYQLLKPYILFIICMAVSSLFGLDAWRSVLALRSFFFFSLIMFVFADACSSIGILVLLTALLCGQTVAGVHTIFDAISNWTLTGIFLGKVTESGQLAITVIVAVGLGIAGFRKQYPFQSLQIATTPHYFVRALTHMLLFTIVGEILAFNDFFQLSKSLQVFAIVGWLLLAGLALIKSISLLRIKERTAAFHYFLLTVIVPVLLVAASANLKRGPWLGIFVGLAILLLQQSKRLLLPLVAGAAMLLYAIEPIRTRIAESSAHFFIAGGRSAIWEIGAELLQRFPLGIGYQNSYLLQKFSTEIPHQLSHFHNNLLNIAVECGWISLAVFLWWIFLLLRTAFFRAPAGRSIFYTTVGAGIVSWQLAGLVEYNVGDSEVMIVVYMVIGVFAWAARKLEVSL